MDQADEVELVDMAPNALRQRIRHGNVYPPERAEQALHAFFREGNLSALREMALRKVSTTVEEDLEEYMREHRVQTVWPAGERVVACVGPRVSDQRVVRRGWRIANRLNAELVAVFVETPDWAMASPEQKGALEANLRLAEDLGAKVVRATGRHVAGELARVAHEQNAASVVIGHSGRSRLRQLLRASVVSSLLRLAPDVDVIVVADREKGP